MSFENSMGMSPADFAALMKNGDMNGANGAYWIIILFLFVMMNGGFNGFGGNHNNIPSGPPSATSADVQRGFDQSSTQATLANMAAQIGNGFGDAATARLDAQMNEQQNLFGLQTALQQTANANQAATNNGMNGIVLGLQQIGSQNAAGLADLKYTVASENCSDRNAINNGIRDLMAQQTANTNAIIQSQQEGFRGVQDKLCAMEIDNLKTVNEQLRQQLNMANLSASQLQQTSRILQDNAQQTASLIGRIAPAPVPAYVVPNPSGGFPGGAFA